MIGMRRGSISALLIAVLLAGVVTPAVGAKLAGDKVRLGVIMPQAGIFVDWGQHGLIGAEIAREEINAAGGIGGLPLELVMADDRGDPKESVTLTRRLAQTDRVLMIHGSISSAICRCGRSASHPSSPTTRGASIDGAPVSDSSSRPILRRSSRRSWLRSSAGEWGARCRSRSSSSSRYRSRSRPRRAHE